MLAERLILSLNEPSFKTVALRPHLIWGPGDPHLLPRLIQRARSGSLFLFKSTALIDATYIDNAAHAHILAAEKLAAGAEIGGRVYFITQGEPLTAIAMIEKLLAAALPLQSPPHLRPKFQLPATWSRPVSFLLETVWSSLKLTGEPPLTRFLAEELTLPHWFNLSRARVELGYKPIVTLVEGLNRLAASFKINQQ
jgi:nucleoside-diphosphate-sugar epimerase